MQNSALLIEIKEIFVKEKKVIYNICLCVNYDAIFDSKVWFLTHNTRSCSQFSQINGMNN
jgi:hypothetical protein